ncbi:hypothetical protein D3C87_1659290 [compost metagenome]
MDPERPVRLPGQAGLKLREQALLEGVSLSQKVIDDLNQCAAQLQQPTLAHPIQL